jgi:folate-dependent phosphoribosylglycinamide formyltransferase PurN
MNTEKKITLLVNDSFFAYCSAKSIIKYNANNISLIIFSVSKSNKNQVFKIFKKVSNKYFIYRSFIHLMSKIFLKKKSVAYLAKKYSIDTISVKSSAELSEKLNSSILGFAFNFDLILKKQILNKFSKGVYNIHASKLPKDRGISPVLWAFARGDKEIWSTIYKIDEGIDTGKILKQFSLSVNEGDTSFSIYKRVSEESGKVLNSFVLDILEDNVILNSQNEQTVSNYCSWPNKGFDELMKNSKLKLITWSDLIT